MRWGDKRYHSLDYELKKIFGQKVLKLSLNGNFTCPNRDGTIGTKGCIFCGEKGSGEFAAPAKLSISDQIQQQKKFLSKKWTANKYIAYFQSFTNTYAPVEQLKQKYKEALSSPDIVGLAIATRPDCLPEETLDLLEELNQTTYLWIELGLQTIHERTAKFIRRGYDMACFENAIAELKKRNIPVVAHLIFGLPYETEQDMLESVQYIATTGIQGIKIHLLHILKDTDLYRFYQKQPFPLLTQEKYISLIVNALEILPPEMIIHRLTGDGARDLLFAPKWSTNKKAVLNGIQHELKKRNTYQGIRHIGR